MPDFQIISGSERPVTAAPVAGAERSLAGEQAVLRGKTAVAQGIQDIGTTAGNAALFSARLKNRADEARVEQAIRREEVDFDTWRENEPDETKWMSEQQARSNRLKTELESMKLAPVVRQQAATRLDSWAQDREAIVNNQATRYANKRHDDVLVSQIALAAEQGDKATIDSVMEERVLLGTVHESTAKIAKQQAYEKADIAQVTRVIQDDPRAAIEQLEAQTEGGRWKNYKDLSETARLSMLRSSKNALETMRAEHAQEIAEQIYRGNVSGIDQRLDYELETGGLTAQTAANLRSFARGQRSTEDMAGDGSRLWQAAIELDPASPDAIQQEMKIRAAVHGLSPEVKDPILDVLNQRRSNTMPPVVQQAYALLDRDYRAEVDTFTKAEVDAMTRKEKNAYEKTFGREPEMGLPKDPTKAAGASERLFRYQDAMRKFILANPKATAEQILGERARLTATDRQAILGAQAIDALSGSVQ